MPLSFLKVTGGNSPLQVGTTCMGGSPNVPHEQKSFLRRRIEVFKDHETSRKQHLLGIALGTVGALVTAGLSYGAQKSLRGEAQQKLPFTEFDISRPQPTGPAVIISKANEELFSKSPQSQASHEAIQVLRQIGVKQPKGSQSRVKMVLKFSQEDCSIWKV